MQNQLKIGGFLVFLMMLFGTMDVNAQWKKIKETEQLVLFQNESPDTVKNFKATFFLNTTLDEVEAYLTNPQNYREWIGPLDEIREVQSQPDSIDYCYFLVNVKPFFQRNGIIKSQVNYNKSHDRLTYQIKLDETYPYPEALDPPRYFQMDWEMQRLTNDRVRIDMYYLGHSRSYNAFVNAILDEFTIMAVQGMITDVMTAMTGE